jgi:putative flippase GtrA
MAGPEFTSGAQVAPTDVRIEQVRVSPMSVTQLSPANQPDVRTGTDVDIAIPVYNESAQLRASIVTLRNYLDRSFPFTASVTIVDNASTDDTWRIARQLAATVPGVSALHLDQKGRGRALRAAWARSSAAVVSYMDVDLATGLDALLPLVAPLLSGQYDLSVGTRLAPGSRVVRGTRREFISRGYNLLLRSTLRGLCTDAQCGFKAMRRSVAAELLPLVEDDEWFFDTEVLVTAQRLGFRIHEVPVEWVDDTDSRVEVLGTALLDLKGVWRMLGPASRQRAVLRPARPPARPPAGEPASVPSDDDGPRVNAPVPHRFGSTGDRSGDGPVPQVFADELLRFAGVGAVSTLAYVGLFAALEPAKGSYVANAVAIGLCGLGNTAAHRGMAGTALHGLDRRHRIAISGVLLGVSLVFSTGALSATRAVGLTSLYPELAAVTVANIGAAVIRFGILRTWVFRPAFGTHLDPGATPHHAGQGAVLPTTERPS